MITILYYSLCVIQFYQLDFWFSHCDTMDRTIMYNVWYLKQLVNRKLHLLSLQCEKCHCELNTFDFLTVQTKYDINFGDINLGSGN